MSDVAIRVRLPWPPSVNAYWRMFVRGKRASMILSKAGRLYRRDAKAAWETARVGADGGSPSCLDGPLAIRLDLVFPDARRRDIDNVVKAVLDAIGHAGGFTDDSQVKLLIVEHVDTTTPGWVDVTLGPRPGDMQGTLFDAGF
jgi:crossover junction endodeoxyribonuclease RusA